MFSLDDLKKTDLSVMQKYSRIEVNLSDFYYHFLRYLSDFFHEELILDLGTNFGHSAVALGLNGQNHVESYDIVCDLTEDEKRRIEEDFNINFNILRVEDIPLSQYEEAKIIFLDTVHDGSHEMEVFDIILKSKFKGILVCDDIFFNEGMNRFWESIKIPKRDLTKEIGIREPHGIGVVMFDSEFNNFLEKGESK
jgi:predicted O-methyltransferase YrrM